MGRRANISGTTSDVPSFGQRLRELKGSEGQDAFARRIGISKGAMHNLLNGAEPSMSVLLAIASATGASLDYLTKGVPNAAGNDVVQVQQLAFGASAGSGALVLDEDAGEIVFPAAILTSLGIPAHRARYSEARGTSMEPTIADDAPILIDIGDTEPRDGSIYVVTIDNEAFVKRWHRAPGRIELHSDNPSSPPILVPPGSILRVIGRVCWVGRQV
jgi:phage repressor protein C with HTH and peptisase S24 domain